MIYLSPEVKSGYGEETFWVWGEKIFINNSFDLPSAFHRDDVVLRYSTKGPLDAKPAKTIALCWELLPEMKITLNENTWDDKIQITYETAKSSDRIVVASRFSIPYYESYGKVDLLPIGVDTNLFREYSEEDKIKTKIKYNVPLDKKIGFWCGSTHKMKGFQNVQKYADENPDIYWIIVFYSTFGNFAGNGQQHNFVTQNVMAELMNCADFQLSASLLRPYYIIEYEGMACNLPQRKILNIEKEWDAGNNPRDKIFEEHWDRETAAKDWINYINNLSPRASKSRVISRDYGKEVTEAMKLLGTLKTSSNEQQQMLIALTTAVHNIEAMQKEFIDHVHKAISLKGIFIRACMLPIRLIRKIGRAGIYALKHPIEAITAACGKCNLFATRFVKDTAAFLKLIPAEEAVFRDTFRQNTWGSEESHSGVGSTLEQTNVIREELPRIVKKYDIKSFLDLPCGDFNWMRHVDLCVERYIGADIVKDIVKANAAKYGGAGCEFKQINLLRSRLPPVDLIFCRDCLVHLSFEDVQKAIANLHRSGIKYLLATTFTNREANRHIQTGDWTPYNLQVMPFWFPEPIEIVNENCIEFYPDFTDKSLGLWRIKDIPRTLVYVNKRNVA